VTCCFCTLIKNLRSSLISRYFLLQKIIKILSSPTHFECIFQKQYYYDIKYIKFFIDAQNRIQFNCKLVYFEINNDFFEFKFLPVFKNSKINGFQHSKINGFQKFKFYASKKIQKLTVFKNPHNYCLQLNEHEKRVWRTIEWNRHSEELAKTSRLPNANNFITLYMYPRIYCLSHALESEE